MRLAGPNRRLVEYRLQLEAGIDIAAGNESMAWPARTLGPSDYKICCYRCARPAVAQPGGVGRTDYQTCFIFTIDGTLRASARHLASAGCRVAARWELAGFIFTIDCTLRASARP